MAVFDPVEELRRRKGAPEEWVVPEPPVGDAPVDAPVEPAVDRTVLDELLKRLESGLYGVGGGLSIGTDVLRGTARGIAGLSPDEILTANLPVLGGLLKAQRNSPEQIRAETMAEIGRQLEGGRNLPQAVAATESERPEDYPGQKMIEGLVFDPLNLVGIPYLARGGAPLPPKNLSGVEDILGREATTPAIRSRFEFGLAGGPEAGGATAPVGAVSRVIGRELAQPDLTRPQGEPIDFSRQVWEVPEPPVAKPFERPDFSRPEFVPGETPAGADMTPGPIGVGIRTEPVYTPQTFFAPEPTVVGQLAQAVVDVVAAAPRAANRALTAGLEAADTRLPGLAAAVRSERGSLGPLDQTDMFGNPVDVPLSQEKMDFGLSNKAMGQEPPQMGRGMAHGDVPDSGRSGMALTPEEEVAINQGRADIGAAQPGLRPPATFEELDANMERLAAHLDDMPATASEAERDDILNQMLDLQRQLDDLPAQHYSHGLSPDLTPEQLDVLKTESNAALADEMELYFNDSPVTAPRKLTSGKVQQDGLLGLIAKSGDFKGELPETVTIQQFREYTGRSPVRAESDRLRSGRNQRKGTSTYSFGRVETWRLLDELAGEAGFEDSNALAEAIQNAYNAKQRAAALRQEVDRAAAAVTPPTGATPEGLPGQVRRTTSQPVEPFPDPQGKIDAYAEKLAQFNEKKATGQDAAFRDMTPSGSRIPLKRGETWESRAQALLDHMGQQADEARQQLEGTPPEAPTPASTKVKFTWNPVESKVFDEDLQAVESVPPPPPQRPPGMIPPGQTNPPPGGPPPAVPPAVPPVPPGGGTPGAVPASGGIRYGTTLTMETTKNVPESIRNFITQTQPSYAARRNTEAGFRQAQDTVYAEGVDAAANRLRTIENWGDDEALQAEAVFWELSRTDTLKAQDFLQPMDEHRLSMGRGIQAGTIRRRMSPEGQVLAMLHNLEDVRKTRGDKVATEAIGNVSETLRRQELNADAVDLTRQAADIAAGRRAMPRATQQQAGRLERAITYLENEGRTPVEGPRPPDQLREMQQWAQETGWLLDHEEAAELLQAVDAIRGLPREARAEAIENLRAGLIAQYHGMLLERRTQFRAAQTTLRRTQGTIDYLGSWGRNPTAPRITNEEARVLARLRKLANANGFVLPEGVTEQLEARVTAIRGMEAGAAQEAAAHQLVRDMREWLDGPLAAMDLTRRDRLSWIKDEGSRLKNDITFLEDAGRNPAARGRGPKPFDVMLRLRKLANQSGWELEHEAATYFKKQIDDIALLPTGQREAAAAEFVATKGSQYLDALERKTADYLAEQMGKPNLFKVTPDARAEWVKRLRQQARDLRYLTNKAARDTEPSTVPFSRAAVLKARELTREAGVVLPTDVARSIIDRAEAIRAFGNPLDGTEEAAQLWMAKHSLMYDVARIIPPSTTDRVLVYLGLPRQIKASFDFSMPMRQGIFGIGNRAWRGAWGPMWKSFRDEGYFHQLMAEVHTHPMAALADKAKLFLSEVGGGIVQGEGDFLMKSIGGTGSKWDVLPEIVEKGTRPFERNAVAFLNKMRMDMFSDMVNRVEHSWGKTLTDADTETIATYINLVTGRGRLPGTMERDPTAQHILNNIFFSFRNWISRLEVPVMLGKAAASLVSGGRVGGMSRPVATVIVQEAAKSMALLTTVMAAASAAGQLFGWPVTVETDLRSSDYGKIKIGPLRYDLLGGEAQNLRYFAQAISGKKKTSGGAIEEADRGESILRLFRSKLSPPAGAVANEIGGSDYLGRPLTVWSRLGDALGVMGVSDARDALDAAGWVGVAATLPATSVGIGVNAYESALDVRDRVARDLYGKNYKALGERSLEAHEVDADPRVQKVFEELNKRELPETQVLPVARKQWQVKSQALETIYSQRFAAAERKGDGAALRRLVQDFNLERRTLADTTLGSPLLKEHNAAKSESGDPRIRYGAHYWSTQPELVDGELDFKTMDAERQAILAEAQQAGVDPAWITGQGKDSYRGERFTDPTVQRVMNQYEAAQRIIRPYYAIMDELAVRNPRYAALIAMRQNAASKKERQKLEASTAWKEFKNKVLTPAKEKFRREHPVVDQALVDWDYASKLITERDTASGFSLVR